MTLNTGLIYTNDNCIGCNRCISGCPVLGANISITQNGRNQIHVDDEKCLHCGLCLETCHHNAREYRDDTERFLLDLKQGVPISLLIAPSFFIIYDESAPKILGYLKQLGVRLMYDVSYGADIATWAYLTYIEKYSLSGAIAPPCSAIVNYIQKYSKLLLDKLIPVHSPLLCLASYIRNYLHNTDSFAFISPCIAKKDEIDDSGNEGLVQYNVTFSHLIAAIKEFDISGYTSEVELSDCGLGSIFPVPGGLTDNIKPFVQPDTLIREVHGEKNVYDYFSQLEERILSGKELPFLIDCLNCRQGCLSGTATLQHCNFDDDIFFRLQKKRKPNPAIPEAENPYLPELPFEERRRRLFARFSKLKLGDFLRTYDGSKFQNESHIHQYEPEYDEKIDAIFQAMYKNTLESRTIDCHSCGYSSCLEMAAAISRGYNSIGNCVHYMKDENYRVSLTDIRTGIPNYNAFLAFTEQRIEENTLCDYVTLLFNINNFKFINQKYGFKRGDLALKEYAAAVSALADTNELIALIGGNDFIGIIKSERLPALLDSLSAIPLYTLSENGSPQPVCVSARIAVYIPDGTDTSPQMLSEKLSTTYHAIQRAQNQTILYYDQAFQEKELREEILMHAIEPAISDREFEVYYQPKVNMNTRQLVGAEALVRWNRNGTYVLPMEFIPVCEKTGLIQKVDFYVLEEVCCHIAEWLKSGRRVVPVSVNFSKHHFFDNTVAERINAVAEKWNIPKHYLEIEFTETAYMADSQNLISSIDKLHEFGIASSMDDFGTGYSSLSMLQNMSFNTLKLDKSFLNDGNLGDARCSAVIENIIKMAKQLNMSIVSEGIETEKELEYMKNMQCDMAQGYLFDKPLPKLEFEKRMKQEFYP